MRNQIWYVSVALLALLPFQNCSGGYQSSTLASLTSSSSTVGSGTTGQDGSAAAPNPNPTPAPAPTTPQPSPVVDEPLPIKGFGFRVTFEDTFQDLKSISNGPTGTGYKWWNGVEQCCMVDSTGLPAVMFPTVYNGVSINPYTQMPGGGLNIGLIKQNNTWYSGVLTSKDKDNNGFFQKYGYFEIKAKMPAGDGVWPAFWLKNVDQTLPGEIDIFEYYGHDAGKTFGITLHDWRNGGNNSNIKDPSFFPQVSGMTDAFHTYGMLWNEMKMTFYFDGQKVWEHDTPDVMKVPYYLLFNNGLGGYWPTDKTPASSQFQVQYVRVYQAP